MRDNRYAFLVERLGEPTLRQDVSPGLVGKYRGELPDLLLGYWESEGLNQFRHGLYTSINPERWQGVVDEWTVGTSFEEFGRFYAITRTAFGKLYLFNRHIGRLGKR